MARLARFDPPALLSDFNTIPGQLEAWNLAVSSWFDAILKIEKKRSGSPPSYYNATAFDPGGISITQEVTWNAFPKRLVRLYGRDRALQLADMLWPIECYRTPTLDPTKPAGLSGVFYRPQDEYCEWHVLRDPETNKIKRLTFTSEPPEYWQALFGFIPGYRKTGIPATRFPGDLNLLLQLYRELVSPKVKLDDLIASAPIKDRDGTIWTAKGQYRAYNKWNTTHGIAHLNSPANSLLGEIELAGDATVLYSDREGRLLVQPDALICYAGYGDPNRNSDPTIGGAVNALSRMGAYVTLQNPVGLYMDHINTSGWRAPDKGSVSDFIRITRGSPGMIERLVIEAPSGRNLSVGDLTISGIPIQFGGQVAECITVKLVAVANITSTPIKNNPVTISSRGYLDPFHPRIVSLVKSLNEPFPSGAVEAFLNQGTTPQKSNALKCRPKFRPEATRRPT